MWVFWKWCHLILSSSPAWFSNMQRHLQKKIIDSHHKPLLSNSIHQDQKGHERSLSSKDPWFALQIMSQGANVQNIIHLALKHKLQVIFSFYWPGPSTKNLQQWVFSHLFGMCWWWIPRSNKNHQSDAPPKTPELPGPRLTQSGETRVGNHRRSGPVCSMLFWGKVLTTNKGKRWWFSKSNSHLWYWYCWILLWSCKCKCKDEYKLRNCWSIYAILHGLSTSATFLLQV